MLLNLPIMQRVVVEPEVPYFLLLDTLDELAEPEKLLQENNFGILIQGV